MINTADLRNLNSYIYIVYLKNNSIFIYMVTSCIFEKSFLGKPGTAMQSPRNNLQMVIIIEILPKYKQEEVTKMTRCSEF